jgi:hypothetical protein
MANIKISDLTAAAAASGTQEFEVNDSLTSKKVTGAQILSYVQANTTPASIGALATSAIGSTVQAYDADLADLATNGPGTGNNQYVKRDASAKVPIGSTWKVYESGGVLFFEVSGVAKAKLDGSGNLTVTGNVTAYGTM